jgi:HD-GYP domain-containing protein (c-di-GMP phosphodiesterase class II)
MSATMTARPEVQTPRGDFMAISASMLRPLRLCGLSLYVCDGDNGQFRLFRAPNIPITPEWIARLEQDGHRKLYISTLEQQEFQGYLRENIQQVVADESLPVGQRFASLNLVVRDVLDEVHGQTDLDASIAKTEELGHWVVDLISRSDAIVSELRGVMYHDYQTFTHSANVAYYCVMLAQECGITSKDELCQIAMGAMLHDLGKREVPDAILTKPGQLTADEFRIVKSHPTIGLRLLGKRADLSFAQLMMVYQHHERLDGSGYPVRSSGSDIHPWARICAIADVFEALFSNRPYRTGLDIPSVLRVMDRQAGTHLDGEVYERWKTLMQKH